MTKKDGCTILDEPAARVVGDWLRALNGGDAGALISLSHPDVEVGGPRGTGRGADLLLDWAERSGIHLDPQRAFGRGDTVVVEQEARWRSAESGEMSGGQPVATVFVVRDGRVASVVRHDDLAGALKETGLDESREIGSG